MQIANRGVIRTDYGGTGSHGSLVVCWMSPAYTRTLFSARWNLACELAHAASLFRPAVRESVFPHLRWWADSRCGLSDCRAGTACWRLCYRDCVHIDNPGHIPGASST